MKKNNKFRTFVKIFMVICGITLIYSSYEIVNWYLSNKKNAEIKKELTDAIIINESPNSDENNSNISTNEYDIDFKALKEKNPDTVAFLKVFGTNIEYIVVKGKDNSYYLKHNYNKEWNVSGWIFSDYHNKFDGNDKNIVIYGHNTQDGSMFGTLNNVITEEWYKNEDNYKIILVTERGNFTYQVFSVYKTDPEEYYINTNFNDREEYVEFLDTIKSRTLYNFNIDLDSTDKILTLSSCTPGGRQRVVLHAKLNKY